MLKIMPKKVGPGVKHGLGEVRPIFLKNQKQGFFMSLFIAYLIHA